MRLTSDHPDFEYTLVFFNDKLCKSILAADDEEGWIQIPDITAMAPLDTTETGGSKPGEDKVEQWEEVPTKLKYGKVEFRSLKKE